MSKVNRTFWMWHPWSNFTEVSTHYGKCPSKAVNQIGKDFLKEVGAWDPPYKIERGTCAYTIIINTTGITLDQVEVSVKENMYNENMVLVKGTGNPKFQSKWVVPVDGDASAVTSQILDSKIMITIPKIKERPLNMSEIFGSFLK